MAATGPLYNRHPDFASTHWTAIRVCAGDDDAAFAARTELCRNYWYPLYAYIKRLGNDRHHAEDLTQDFFTHILRRPWLARADQSKGRFRTFLLASLDNFLRDQFDRNRARKRGGTYQHVPHDLAERRDQAAFLTASTSSTQLYEVEWASTVIAATLGQLEAEYTEAGKQKQFEHLKGFLTAGGSLELYQSTAIALGTTVANVKVSVHRLRKQYGIILRRRVAMTVAAPEDVQEEMNYLREVLAGSL